ncbi:TonB-dependent receptor [Bradyrhizobium prioriisuperbiae]|uniref:TonB-dependent receptor n=1 Tax=Bradyrhizobium prioriisuperbiae TaxID=2854389 RepID=UPI0028E1A4CE|nr:TonB-dependent receptor [Bradyrhizobium prioritasuperba]
MGFTGSAISVVGGATLQTTHPGSTLAPTDQWMIEPRITYVSKRYSGNNETSPLDPYTRIDLYTEYKIDPTWKVYARGENIFNAQNQEALNFGTTGPAPYGGVSATW